MQQQFWLAACSKLLDNHSQTILEDRQMNDLQIEDLVVGTGKTCVKGALITAHYTGWLLDGTKFDSSHDRGQPFQCVIGTGRVIKGWDQGMPAIASTCFFTSLRKAPWAARRSSSPVSAANMRW